MSRPADGRAERPRVIFANLVNELMTEVAAPGHAAGLTAVSPRKVWLARPGDLVVTPAPLEEELERFALGLLGLEPGAIHTLSPPGGVTETLSARLRSSDAGERLRAFVGRSGAQEMVPFALDRPTVELCRELGLRPAGFDHLPSDELVAEIYRLNTKSGFRRTARELGFATAPGAACEGREGLMRRLPELLGATGGVIVKRDRSSNGYGNFVLREADLSERSLEGLVGAVLERAEEQPERFVVEALMEFVALPSVEMVCGRRGVRPLYTCDQRSRNYAWFGMITPPPDLPPGILAELDRIGRVFGRHLRGLGYRGVFDVDCGLTGDGRLYVTETNLRRTGGTYLHHLLERLLGAEGAARSQWIADSRRGRRTGFASAVAALRRAGVLFDPERGAGVILTADTVAHDGKWRYLAVAAELDRLSALERAVEEALGLEPA